MYKHFTILILNLLFTFNIVFANNNLNINKSYLFIGDSLFVSIEPYIHKYICNYNKETLCIIDNKIGRNFNYLYNNRQKYYELIQKNQIKFIVINLFNNADVKEYMLVTFIKELLYIDSNIKIILVTTNVHKYYKNSNNILIYKTANIFKSNITIYDWNFISKRFCNNDCFYTDKLHLTKLGQKIYFQHMIDTINEKGGT